MSLSCFPDIAGLRLAFGELQFEDGSTGFSVKCLKETVEWSSGNSKPNAEGLNSRQKKGHLNSSLKHRNVQELIQGSRAETQQQCLRSCKLPGSMDTSVEGC